MQTYKKKIELLEVVRKKIRLQQKNCLHKIIQSHRNGKSIQKINPNTTRVLGSTIEYTEL